MPDSQQKRTFEVNQRTDVMPAPGSIPLLGRLVSWLGYLLLQSALVVLYGLHLIRAFRSPFRANELPRAAVQPYFWARPVIG